MIHTKVASYSTEAEAELAKELLENNSITTLIKKDASGGLRTAAALDGAYEIWVETQNTENARGLLGLE